MISVLLLRLPYGSELYALDRMIEFLSSGSWMDLLGCLAGARESPPSPKPLAYMLAGSHLSRFGKINPSPPWSSSTEHVTVLLMLAVVSAEGFLDCTSISAWCFDGVSISPG